MFGIDFSEILVIFGIALVVLGPERLPKLAATIGRWIGRARAMARQFREQLEQEAKGLHQDMDLGADFGNEARAPKISDSITRPAARPASPSPSGVTPPSPVMGPSAATPAAAAPSEATAAAPAEAVQSDARARVAPAKASPALEPLHESIWPPDDPA